MLKLHHVAVIIILMTIQAQGQFVDCPSTPDFANCYRCFRFTPLYPIQCQCRHFQFSVMSRCFSPKYPCMISYHSVMNNPAYPKFNIWNPVIAPFWSQKLEEAKNHTTEPSPLPSILNYYNFTNMTAYQSQGWTQAYFMYKSFQKEIQSLSLAQQYTYLFQAVSLMDSLLGISNDTKWQNVTNFINSRFSKNYTVYLLRNITSPKITKLLPCHKCNDIYGILYDNNMSRCTKCPPNCKQCTGNASNCTSCLPAYYKTDNATCQFCARSNCVSCNATQCLGCRNGYTLVGGECSQCVGWCSNCVAENPGICTTCTFIFYGQTPKSNGQCVVCDDLCWDCNPNKPSECLKCQDFHYLDNTTKTCKKCPENCVLCSPQGCINCAAGYGVINNTCQICLIPGCYSCNGFQTACTSCVTPYTQYNLTTMRCEPVEVASLEKPIYQEITRCRAGCDYCYDNDTSKCMSCHQRYYADNVYYCKKCMPGCLQCVNSTTCLTALTGYVIAQNMAVRCPQNCRECSPTNTSKCLFCRQGYTLISQTCTVLNRPDCLAYNQAKTTQCIICMPGYVLTDAKVCIQCMSGCQWTCNPLNISQCIRNRYEIGNWFMYEHYLGNQGCYAEIHGHCVKPDQGYRIYRSQNGSINVAIQCLYPCKTCNYTTCFSCEPGYIFNNGKCTFDFTCNPNCTQCLAGTQRNLANNFCMACTIEGCSSCKDGICYECIEGFYFNGTACVKCQEKCRVCYDANNCNICSVGYLWQQEFRDYSYDCVKCDENCKTCKFHASACSQCYPGMKLINFRCRKQFHLAFTYKLDYDYNAFLSNMKSEVLIGALMNILKVKYNDIFITSITNGSTIVSGVVSAIDEAAARSLFNQLKSATLTDFTVKGYSVSFMNDEYTVKCVSKGSAECPAGTQGLSPGAIAGIVIGSIVGVVLIVVGIVCAVKRCRRPDTAGQSEQGEVQIKSSTSKTISVTQSASSLHKKY